MHEQSAVQALLTRALQQARESNTSQIKSVQIAIGEISELDQDAVGRLWEQLSHGTAAERAQLRFRSIHAEVQCMACFEKYHPVDKQIHCPYCGSYGAKILTGEEFHLESVELE
jgi:hydrogenase nickel incorporation protein HypA/HybF